MDLILKFHYDLSLDLWAYDKDLIIRQFINLLDFCNISWFYAPPGLRYAGSETIINTLRNDARKLRLPFWDNFTVLMIGSIIYNDYNPIIAEGTPLQIITKLDRCYKLIAFQ